MSKAFPLEGEPAVNAEPLESNGHVPPNAMSAREDRRAKREARRAKQRENNVGRAAKMRVARLAWEHATGSKSTAPTTASSRQVHVGCSGWFYWHWRGGFYRPNYRPTDGSSTIQSISTPSNSMPLSIRGRLLPRCRLGSGRPVVESSFTPSKPRS
jgi:hypothetical protein